MTKKIKAAILGISGFTGEELIKLLLKHPSAEIVYLGNRLDSPQKNISEIYPQFKDSGLVCTNMDVQKKGLSGSELKKADVVFLALPHTVAMETAKILLDDGKKVIDLSADFRLKDAQVYEKWYKTKHTCPELLKKAVYGMSEIYREQIKTASLLANPGCYPTTIILGCAPLLKENIIETSLIIADCKSGHSGGGRAFSKKYLAENALAYPYNTGGQHRHLPEMEQELSNLAKQKVYLNFNPHVIPQERGMVSAIYLKPRTKTSIHELIDLYTTFYKNEQFVRILPASSLPLTLNIVNTNFCDISVSFDESASLITVMSAIDNLLKGASGQAVQNMNIMFGLNEKLGLI